jgi:hypothetical protein
MVCQDISTAAGRLILALAVCALLAGCRTEGAPAEPAQPPSAACGQAPSGPPDRESRIPADAVKVTADADPLPPELHSSEWDAPVPLPAPINTAGAEDSAFITPDGKTLYFFFTPDVRVPPQKQLLDGVTGIWVSEKEGNVWRKPVRVVLQDPGKLALDGAPFVLGDTLWFCSAREGYTGVNMFTARWKDGRWRDPQYVGNRLMKDFQLGEMHVTADGAGLYFHSPRPGGKGRLDLWVSRQAGGQWQEPANVAAVNSDTDDGWPFVTPDGKELWFLRTHKGSPAIFRSKAAGGQWQPPELVLSQFAAEPSLDTAGNIYFTHHFFRDGKMIEADIYVARRKPAAP